MATCNFGASSVKVSNLNLGFAGSKLGALRQLHSLTNPTPNKFPSLLIANSNGEASIRFKCLSQIKEATISKVQDDTEKEEASSAISPLIPDAYEVEALLTQICDTSSIAEFKLKLGGFQLHVKRNLTVKSNAAPAPVSSPVSVNAVAEAPELNGSASAPSLAITKSTTTSGGTQTFLDKAGDEGLVILQSPRVGYFRRSRTIKGKKAPPPCKEKQAVKEGQVLCYIEQLGGEIPIESDISGEVIKILRQDGDPVGYGDALITILPSFPGIKKLQ